MNNFKNDDYYIRKVIENIDVISLYTKGVSYDEFRQSALIIDAVMFRLVQMAENIVRISANYKEQHSNIEWTKIIGFRNKIVHDYGKTNYILVYEVICKTIIDLKNELSLSAVK